MPVVKTSYLSLKWDEDTLLRFEAKDRDVFFKTINEAIKACRASERQVEFNAQFKESLLPKLKKWLNTKQDKVKKAFLTVRDRGLLFIVIRKEMHYDDEFTTQLIDLDWEISHDPNFSTIDLEVLALPICDSDNFDSFCDSTYTLKF